MFLLVIHEYKLRNCVSFVFTLLFVVVFFLLGVLVSYLADGDELVFTIWFHDLIELKEPLFLFLHLNDETALLFVNDVEFLIKVQKLPNVLIHYPELNEVEVIWKLL